MEKDKNTSKSVSDENTEYMNPMAAPFFLKGAIEDECVLIIHGFTSTPASIRPLAEALNKNGQGYNVRAMLLPEHGTKMEDLNHSKWKKWFSAGVNEFNLLKKTYKKVSVAGFSLGGNIALCMAANCDIHRLITISTPIIIKNRLSYIAEFLSIFRKYTYWGKSKDLPGELNFDYPLGYSGMPVRAIAEVRKSTIASFNRLGRVNQPILIAQSKKDKTVQRKSPYLIYNHVNSNYKELLFLENARHNPIISPDREHLFRSVYNFLQLDINDEKIIPD